MLASCFGRIGQEPRHSPFVVYDRPDQGSAAKGFAPGERVSTRSSGAPTVHRVCTKRFAPTQHPEVLEEASPLALLKRADAA
jgi:hypothetical protein